MAKPSPSRQPSPPGPPPHVASPRLARLFSARPRLWLSMLLGLAVYALLPDAVSARSGTRALIGWNVGALFYLALAVHLLIKADHGTIQRRAREQSEHRSVVLAMVVVAAVAVLLAVGSQLAAIKAMPDSNRAPHLGLAALTVFTSWAFTQTLFALNYAHDFYTLRAAGMPDPLSFPGTPDPRYADFFYFSAVIGTSGQTADVAFNGAALRPVGALHCVLAFFFNTTVLALTINIAAGLF